MHCAERVHLSATVVFCQLDEVFIRVTVTSSFCLPVNHHIFDISFPPPPHIRRLIFAFCVHTEGNLRNYNHHPCLLPLAPPPRVSTDTRFSLITKKVHCRPISIDGTFPLRILYRTSRPIEGAYILVRLPGTRDNAGSLNLSPSGTISFLTIEVALD